jgi:hypothetical protein
VQLTTARAEEKWLRLIQGLFHFRTYRQLEHSNEDSPFFGKGGARWTQAGLKQGDDVLEKCSILNINEQDDNSNRVDHFWKGRGRVHAWGKTS